MPLRSLLLLPHTLLKQVILKLQMLKVFFHIHPPKDNYLFNYNISHIYIL